MGRRPMDCWVEPWCLSVSCKAATLCGEGVCCRGVEQMCRACVLPQLTCLARCLASLGACCSIGSSLF